MGVWVDVWMDGSVNGCVCGWMGGCVDGCVDGWMDGWQRSLDRLAFDNKQHSNRNKVHVRMSKNGIRNGEFSVQEIQQSADLF
jgi:hypothetical protein